MRVNNRYDNSFHPSSTGFPEIWTLLSNTLEFVKELYDSEDAKAIRVVVFCSVAFLNV